MYAFLRTIVRPLLPVIRKIYNTAKGIRSIGGSGGMITVELRRHNGETVRLPDGCEVRSGDPVLKVHLDDAWITEKRSSGWGQRTINWPRGVMRYFKEGFQLVASQIASGKYGEVVAVYGWTVLHAPARRFGFQVIDLPNNLRTKLARVYIGAMMEYYNIRGRKRYKSSRERLKVKAVWLSREEFLRLYRSQP